MMVNDQIILSSNSTTLSENNWTNIVLTYEDVNGTLSLFANSDLVDSSAGHYFSGTKLSSRFTSLVLGGGLLPIDGRIDDFASIKYLSILTMFKIYTVRAVEISIELN